jgi:hypothetical protein
MDHRQRGAHLDRGIGGRDWIEEKESDVFSFFLSFFLSF